LITGQKVKEDLIQWWSGEEVHSRTITGVAQHRKEETGDQVV
jgi:hypothetical protein